MWQVIEWAFTSAAFWALDAPMWEIIVTEGALLILLILLTNSIVKELKGEGYTAMRELQSPRQNPDRQDVLQPRVQEEVLQDPAEAGLQEQPLESEAPGERVREHLSPMREAH